jgi:endonuclease/exonuclease/phosphatase family metal-dependent hydrolase
MFISKRIGEHTHLVHSRDCQEVRIKTESSGELRLVNIYNDQQQGAALRLLQDKLPPVREQKEVSYLVMGDFNLHHPVWGGDDAPRDARAEDLLDLMETAGLDNWLAPGTITRDQAGHRSTIDLTLASYSLREQIVVCEVDHRAHADSDHLPIRTLLEINLPELSDPVKRRNWKAMDVEKFLTFVSSNLTGRYWMCLQGEGSPSPCEIDYAVSHLIDII